jgi:hypothetical protein
MTGPVNANQPPMPVSHALAAVAAVSGPVIPGNLPAAPPRMSTDGIQAPAARTGQTPASAVNLTAPQPEAAAPELFVNDNNQIVTADGQPYLNVEMFLGPNDQIVDAQGKAIDLGALEAQAGVSNPQPAQPLSEADQKVMRRVKMATAGASGAMGVGMDYLWYRSTLGGMQRRVTSMQAASKAFKAGTSLQGKLKDTPVVGSVVTKLQSRRTEKVGTLQRSIKIANMTPVQEGRFIAQERLKALKLESKAFRTGQSRLGRMKETPVVGSIAKGVESRRQATIKRLQAEIKTPASQAGTWTKVKNATRGRIFPAIMLASDGYSIYQGVKQLNAAGNTRKWDDALRIGGNAVSAGGDIMAFKRGNIGGAVATHAVGMVIGTVGSMFDDQN